MKRNWLGIFILYACVMSFISPAWAVETLTLDAQHTYVLWRIKHFDFSTQAGKWYANGALILDKAKPQNSKLTVTIPLANIVTGIPELDQHLKGKPFFDIEHYPNATFVSNKVEMTGEDSAKVQGMLTLHGISKPVTLEVKLNKQGVNPITDKMTYGFSAHTIIKRSDFGIQTLLPGLADEVDIDIEAEAVGQGK